MDVFDADHILTILDKCCESYTFPMLDNGYVYLAATRLSLYRSATNWAMVIEVFGFSPRAGLPDDWIHTFASTLHNRDRPENCVTREEYERYLANNPHNDQRAAWPLEGGAWQEEKFSEWMAPGESEFVLRGQPGRTPAPSDYRAHGIELEEPLRVRIHEFCRWLAAVARESVLATPDERRFSVQLGMEQILQLEDWRHPRSCGG